jgi:hypothetical protein
VGLRRGSLEPSCFGLLQRDRLAAIGELVLGALALGGDLCEVRARGFELSCARLARLRGRDVGLRLGLGLGASLEIACGVLGGEPARRQLA